MAEKLFTPVGTLSYPSLFKSRLSKDAEPGAKPTFDTVLLFTKEAEATAEFKAMQAAALAVLREKFGAKTDDMLREGSLKTPFKRDMAAKGYPAEFTCYINVSANEDFPPSVLDVRRRGADGKPLPITDKREIYPGAKAILSVVPYTFDRKGNKGAKFGLRNVLKMGDGPRIDNTVSAEDEFAGVAAPADSEVKPAEDFDSLM